MCCYGYCRVSTVVQNEARQVEAMKKLGIEEENIIIEKASGKNFRRPKYNMLLGKLKAGDLLVVSSIDRLGRNYDEIISQWTHLVKDVQADILVLDMPLLDTRKEHDLTGHLISDVVLQLLSYCAQKERESILARQAEGIAIAKQSGVRFGRKPLKIPEEFITIKRMCDSGDITIKEASQRLGISYPTYRKWCVNTPLYMLSSYPHNDYVPCCEDQIGLREDG